LILGLGQYIRLECRYLLTNYCFKSELRGLINGSSS
ncbi:unnamed protein product, partial [marine sediment metagenome]